MRKEMKGVMVAFFGLAAALPTSVLAQGQASSHESMIGEAQNGVQRIEAIIESGTAMLEKARSESDVTKIDCINTALVNTRGFLNVAQNGETNLREAIQRRDEESTSHHYKLVQLAVNKSEALGSKMAECGAEILGVSGETRTTTTQTCKVEPCLQGEGKNIESAEPGKTDVDASPYL